METRNGSDIYEIKWTSCMDVFVMSGVLSFAAILNFSIKLVSTNRSVVQLKRVTFSFFWPLHIYIFEQALSWEVFLVAQ